MKLQRIAPFLALFILHALLLTTMSLASQKPIALWDFNQTNDLLRATSGTGSLAVLGGVRAAAASGTGSSDPSTNADFALQLSGFLKQGTGAKTAGLEISASTVGFQSIVLQFDVRATSTASRRIQVLYSTNGPSLMAGPSFTLTVPSVFTNALTADLSHLPDIANNPHLRIHLVSDWEGDAYVGVGGNYSTVGTWRLDHLRLMGVPVGGPPVDPDSGNTHSDSGTAVPPITITGQPMSLTVPEGGGAVFQVSAQGPESLSYQWCLNGQPLPGAIRQELRIAQVYRDHLGLYTVRISNGEGSILSEEASLTLLSDPTVTPTRVEAVPGPGGSIELSWPTRAGSTYSVLRSVGWNGPPVVIAQGLTSGSLTEIPPAGDIFFYWVQVQ